MEYDVIIIGLGPAGLSSAIYAARYYLKTLAVGGVVGGAMGTAHRIENYPGVPAGSGLDLALKMQSQAKEFGAEIVTGEVMDVKKNEDGTFLVSTGKEGEEPYRAKAVIIAAGTQRRNLGVPGERELLGRGVSYCSTCDGAFFKGKKVAVVGGGGAATMSAIHLTEYADKIYLIYRGEALRGEPIWNERVTKHEKITVLYNANVTEIGGEKNVESITLDREITSSDGVAESEGTNKLKVDGIFIEIGATPAAQMAVSLGLDFTPAGFVKVAEGGATNIPGVFAAGDITANSGNFWQVVTAAAEGAIAAKSAYEYLAQARAKKPRQEQEKVPQE